jgi:glycosyltransferase involved in cell wall biosynthesis
MKGGDSSSGPQAVSVVVPAYNYAHYLPSAIASLLGQSHSALEIVIVDDGSTDGTREAVAKFTDPRVRYVRQENAGLSAARNTGIREARHAFIGLLDADDGWEPGFLARVMAQFAALEPGFGAVATAASRMGPDGVPVVGGSFSFGRSGELTVRDFCLRNRPLSSNIVLRKDVFAQCGDFDPALRSSEDRDMWIRLTARGWRFFFLDEPLARIRRHPHNMSRNAPRMKANSRRVLTKARAAGAVPRWSPFWLRAFSVHYYQIAWTHYDDGFRARAFAYLAASWLLWPFFAQPSRLSEKPLFRARALVRFILNFARSKAP